ncbi:hypothetical protein OsJ_26859 [Oryza sativa Japonica Group]|uniref:Uncharacterized protein n=1 Tax=Oryza sativa subsp. japonica TaxID=39947 RepID=B9G096_ORYSJ|nr:hypothetical protein OsJ_26859 [Oryza sativa Japonica Group]
MAVVARGRECAHSGVASRERWGAKAKDGRRARGRMDRKDRLRWTQVNAGSSIPRRAKLAEFGLSPKAPDPLKSAATDGGERGEGCARDGNRGGHTAAEVGE